jgi:hypothetical protein
MVPSCLRASWFRSGFNPVHKLLYVLCTKVDAHARMLSLLTTRILERKRVNPDNLLQLGALLLWAGYNGLNNADAIFTLSLSGCLKRLLCVVKLEAEEGSTRRQIHHSKFTDRWVTRGLRSIFPCATREIARA